MNNREAVNWLINISADIGKVEHSDLWHYEQALTEIKDMLESAQPEAPCYLGSPCEYQNPDVEIAQLSQEGTTKGTTTDTISRQAVIDALNGLHYNDREDWCFVLDTIEHLPSAQTEHTCVNCGRTVNNGGWYADGRTRCPIEEHYALPKDGYCHLWEKRNVTDDDYPERREE